mgnify:CR=1 FL=1
MDPRDIRTLESLSTSNPEVARLLRLHTTYEEQLDALQRHRWLSPDEQRELKRLKQLKLAGRDRLAAILAATQTAQA